MSKHSKVKQKVHTHKIPFKLFDFILANYFQAWGLPLRVANKLVEMLLEKADFPFDREYHYNQLLG